MALPETGSIPSKEQIRGILEEIQRDTVRALQDAGLSSTANLCHEVNLGIALAFAQKSGLPLRAFEQIDFASGSDQAVVGLVHDGSLRTRDGKRPHCFIVITGETGLLVDGANDQMQKSKPFLVVEIPHGHKLQFIERAVSKYNRGIRKAFQSDGYEKGFLRMRDYFTPEKVIPWVSKLAVSGDITDDQLQSFMEQFTYENACGLGPMLFMRMRDWIQYLLGRNGIQYPSVQPIVDALFAGAKIAPIHMTHPTYRPLALLGQQLIQTETEG
jgi:hypothetical protein